MLDLRRFHPSLIVDRDFDSFLFVLLESTQSARLGNTDLREDSRLDQSDSDGTFLLGGMLPGRYWLVAIEDGWDLEWTNGTVLKPYLTKGQSLQISANDQKKVTVEVQHKM